MSSFDPQSSIIAFSFRIRSSSESTSVYLAGETAAFLESKLNRGFSVSKYILFLLKRYQSNLPKHLPKNRTLRKIIQPRVENRKRYAFRMRAKHFWELTMLAKSVDMSLGALVSILIYLEMNELGRKIKKTVVISTFRSHFKLSYSPKFLKIHKFLYFRQPTAYS